MSLAKITEISGRGVYVPGDDLDTDRIIPARFMKCVTFDGLGEYLFYDARHNDDGSKRGHPLDDPRFAGASILVSGNNFGCGSSREHAPQAIYRAGFRAVVAEGFAEIFFGNSTQLGIPCVKVTRAVRERIAAALAADPQIVVTLDLVHLTIRYGGEVAGCELRDGARRGLIEGRWDPIGELLEATPMVEAVANRLPAMPMIRL